MCVQLSSWCWWVSSIFIDDKTLSDSLNVVRLTNADTVTVNLSSSSSLTYPCVSNFLTHTHTENIQCIYVGFSRLVFCFIFCLPVLFCYKKIRHKLERKCVSSFYFESHFFCRLPFLMSFLLLL